MTVLVWLVESQGDKKANHCALGLVSGQHIKSFCQDANSIRS